MTRLVDVRFSYIVVTYEQDERGCVAAKLWMYQFRTLFGLPATQINISSLHAQYGGNTDAQKIAWWVTICPVA